MEQLVFPITQKEAKKSGVVYSSEANKGALFPSRLRKLREEKGISQAVLSATLGVSKSTVGLWETGDTLPDAKSLHDMADYFDVSVDYMLCRSGIKTIAADIQAAAKYSGLSDSALETIARLPPAEKDILSAVICSFNLDAILRGFSEIDDCAKQLNRELQGKGGLYEISLEKGWIAPEDSLVDDDSLIDRYSELRLSRFEAIDLFTRELDFLFNIQQLQEQYFESAYPRLDDIVDESNETASGAGDAESGQ